MSSSTTDQIRDVVYDIVSRHLHLKKGALKPDMDASEDADIFLRIVRVQYKKVTQSKLPMANPR